MMHSRMTEYRQKYVLVTIPDCLNLSAVFDVLNRKSYVGRTGRPCTLDVENDLPINNKHISNKTYISNIY